MERPTGAVSINSEIPQEKPGGWGWECNFHSLLFLPLSENLKEIRGLLVRMSLSWVSLLQGCGELLESSQAGAMSPGETRPAL